MPRSPAPIWQETFDTASLVAQRLIDSSQRIVLAESCTSGLMAATIGGVPGVSAAFCGSAVTYRDATKRSWLGIEQRLLSDFTAVSEPVTQEMAKSVLQRTVEADWSLAITGHLGPAAPATLDGRVHVSIAFADRSARSSAQIRIVSKNAWKLESKTRRDRQFESCLAAWQLMASVLERATRG